MGLENLISKLPKKRLELLKNLVSVFVIFTILYAVFILAQLGNPLDFFKTQAFVYVCMILLLLSIAWKMLNGSKMQFPDDLKQKSKPKKKQQKPKQRQSYTQPKKSAPIGSWQCPKCKSFVVGYQCLKCGYKR